MRLIHEAGTIDVPYERVCLEVDYDAGADIGGVIADCWTIRAYDTADNTETSWVMGVFFDEQKALDAMRLVASAYGLGSKVFRFGKVG